MFDEYKPLIAEALGRVYEVAEKTALDYMPQISAACGNHVRIKREDQQPVFSYKLRGAYNFLSTLDGGNRDVIAASAGNHAQGVALAAQRLGIHATIVMPKTTPEIKVNAVRQRGARVVLHGNTYDDAFERAAGLCKSDGGIYVPPYDHPLIIAGQATVAVEILNQSAARPDIVFVPVGGGGLIAGMALYLKSIDPAIRVIGVESDEAPCMQRALEAGTRTKLEHIGIFVDGAAVKQAGAEPFRICRELVDGIVLVNNDEVCAAIKDIFEDTRAIAEPAGALALAGLKQYVAANGVKDRHLVAVFSGANINFDRLRHIAELAALGEQREALLCVRIPERPGSFRTLCQDLGARGVTEFNYRYADAREAHVFVGVQLRHGADEKDLLTAHLQTRGYRVVDMSSDEIAKMHVRYMVGGRAAGVADELLYRFEFPERSGALLHFLTELGDRWNISLFHYRNHGAAYGRVLTGIQVPPAERGEFGHFLARLGLAYAEETSNPAYQAFLK